MLWAINSIGLQEFGPDGLGALSGDAEVDEAILGHIRGQLIDRAVVEPEFGQVQDTLALLLDSGTFAASEAQQRFDTLDGQAAFEELFQGDTEAGVLAAAGDLLDLGHDDYVANTVASIVAVFLALGISPGDIESLFSQTGMPQVRVAPGVQFGENLHVDFNGGLIEVGAGTGLLLAPTQSPPPPVEASKKGKSKKPLWPWLREMLWNMFTGAGAGAGVGGAVGAAAGGPAGAAVGGVLGANVGIAAGALYTGPRGDSVHDSPNAPCPDHPLIFC